VEFLNYHHLRYFWAVAKEGGLSQASKRLNVSQPTISEQIQSLEMSLGVKLFRRSGRKLELTETGHSVYRFAEDIFSIGSDLLDTIRRRPIARQVSFAMGIADSVPKLIAYKILKPVFDLEQSFQVSCVEGKVIDLLAQLSSFRLDIVLSDEPAPGTANFKVFNHRLGDCGIVFLAAKKLAAKIGSAFPQSLDRQPALLPAEKTDLRRSLEQWFQTQGIRPQLVAQFEDTALMKVAAQDGLGFLPLAEVAAEEAIKRYGLKMIGSTDRCLQQFYLISAERRLNHPAVVELTQNAKRSLFGA
jgi:LysR family transcriptional activator of nhaA